ncbi:MAG TPA: zf-HC2 domain-containing protein [Candidatus Tumulicola sp.]
MNDTHLTFEDLIDYAHGELSAARDAQLHAHLAECPTCFASYHAELNVGDSLRAYARETERDLPPGFAQAIVRNAIERRPSFWERWSVALRPLVAVPVAAALVLVAFFAMGRHGSTPRRFDPSYYLEDHAALAASVPFEDSAALPAMMTSDETVQSSENAP